MWVKRLYEAEISCIKIIKGFTHFPSPLVPRISPLAFYLSFLWR